MAGAECARGRGKDGHNLKSGRYAGGDLGGLVSLCFILKEERNTEGFQARE